MNTYEITRVATRMIEVLEEEEIGPLEALPVLMVVLGHAINSIGENERLGGPAVAHMLIELLERIERESAH